MEIRFGYKKGPEHKSKQYVHMLNATLTATERTMCCLLENYQTPDGIVIPVALRPYMFGLEKIPYVKPKPVDKPQKH